MSDFVLLKDARDESRFGGKCASLAKALQAGLPAPGGYALGVGIVARIAAGSKADCERVRPLFDELAPAMAVRSSAIGEDSNAASFAGMHLSVLNIMDIESLFEAIRDVHQSAHTNEARAYRARMQVSGEPAIAVAIQKQILSDMAGVMFTRNPLTGDTERYIEAGWGLGEAIVSGLIVPDTYRIATDGTVLERRAGEKDLLLVAHKDGNVMEQAVAEDKIEALCLGDAELKQLHELANACEKVYGAKLDIEWAFYQGQIYLLQCRGITR